jgi:DNA-binding NarL/FixJ family response regulator
MTTPATPSAAIRIIVADDHQVVRTGFAALLDTQPDFTVAGTACDGAEAVRICRDLHPDVVLMDIRMPGMDGIQATRQLTGSGQGGPRILILTTFDLDEYVYDALRAGASGFLLKDVTPNASSTQYESSGPARRRAGSSVSLTNRHAAPRSDDVSGRRSQVSSIRGRHVSDMGSYKRGSLVRSQLRTPAKTPSAIMVSEVGGAKVGLYVAGLGCGLGLLCEPPRSRCGLCRVMVVLTELAAVGHEDGGELAGMAAGA